MFQVKRSNFQKTGSEGAKIDHDGRQRRYRGSFEIDRAQRQSSRYATERIIDKQAADIILTKQKATAALLALAGASIAVGHGRDMMRQSKCMSYSLPSTMTSSLRTIWAIVFIMFGKSIVTGAQSSFHLDHDRI